MNQTISSPIVRQTFSAARLPIVIAVAFMLISTSSFRAEAQQSGQVTDLTERDFNSEQLVEALSLPFRGLAADCSGYQEKMEQMTRGIGFTPTSAEEVPAFEAAKAVRLTINFELNSDQLTADARAGLKTVAEALQSQNLAAQCFQLAGHTCDLGPGELNMSLSRRRADAVKSFLVREGVDGDRIVTTGFGETAPQTPNVDESARRKNRRVELGALAPAGEGQ